MYHPAAALHQGSLRRTIEADMLKIPQILAQGKDMPQDAVESQQLSLF
jgi:DNA polymerase